MTTGFYVYMPSLICLITAEQCQLFQDIIEQSVIEFVPMKAD
jgi:hypothetical protein